MKILIAGASGLVGQELIPYLTKMGHQVKKLVRDSTLLREGEFLWNPENHQVDLSAFEGCDAVINLAGENISSGRWNESKKKSILSSRINATNTLVNAILQLQKAPKIFINASAIGYYGNRGDEILDEASRPGEDFLAHVCIEWEQAASPLLQKNTRVIYTRFGIILSAKAGALNKMLIPFKLGLGGVMGSGDQYMSWIAIDDVVRIIDHILQTESLEGPLNVVSPNPVTNKTYTKTLGKVLARPTLLPLPAFVARLVFGEMADALLLSSQRVSDKKLKSSGFQFLYPDLEKALVNLINPTID